MGVWLSFVPAEVRIVHRVSARPLFNGIYDSTLQVGRAQPMAHAII